MTFNKKVIVALDSNNFKQTENLVDKIKEQIFKEFNLVLFSVELPATQVIPRISILLLAAASIIATASS